MIGKGKYYLQQEWSNAVTGCVLNFGAVNPTAAFTSSPATPQALDPVSFDGTGSHANNGGGYIIDYSWDFGDSNTGSGATPSHTYAVAGSYNVKLTVTDDAGLTDSVTHTVTVVHRATTLTYTGGTSRDYHDTVTVSSHLMDTTTSAPIASKPIVHDWRAIPHGSTNGSGDASCPITLGQIPGPLHLVSASFAGDPVYAASSDSKTFTITKEETTLIYTGPTVILVEAGSRR